MKLRAGARPRRHSGARLYLETLEHRAVPAILTEGHVDIGMAYDGVAWDLHVHDETNDVEYEPGEVLLYLPRNTRAIQPTNPDYAFIGAGAGNPIWLLPQVQEPEKMLLGIGAEEIAPGTFASYFEADRRVQGEGEWIRLDLIDVQGPVGGEMAVWQTDSFGKVIHWMSTHTNRPSDTTFTLACEHGDHNWAFTAPGIYEVSFQASAYLGPGMMNKVESDVVMYHFGVESCGAFCPPIPPADGGGNLGLIDAQLVLTAMHDNSSSWQSASACTGNATTQSATSGANKSAEVGGGARFPSGLRQAGTIRIVFHNNGGNGLGDPNLGFLDFDVAF